MDLGQTRYTVQIKSRVSKVQMECILKMKKKNICKRKKKEENRRKMEDKMSRVCVCKKSRTKENVNSTLAVSFYGHYLAIYLSLGGRFLVEEGKR